MLSYSIAEINEKQDLFSTIIRTSSPYSFFMLNDINQSYTWSLNNHMLILKEIKEEKIITKEIYDKHVQDFILNTIWNGYLPVYDNINVTSKNLISNQINLQKKLLYKFDDQLASISLKTKLTDLSTLKPNQKNNCNSVYNLCKTLDLSDIIQVLKQHNILIYGETLNFYFKIKSNYNYGSFNIENIPTFKQNILNNLHIKNNLSKIITDW